MHHAVRRARLIAVAVATALTASACFGAAEAEDEGVASAAATVEEAAAPVRYVALGDSYTAAPFVPSVVEAKGCYRSTGNYPALIAQALPGTESVDASCSAADTTHMTTKQRTVTGKVVPPQFEALTPETDLVTIGIGGNDFEVFGTLITECPQLAPTAPRGAPCRDAMRGPRGDLLLGNLKQTQKRVVGVIEGVQELTPEARILVIGYPQITPRRGTCAAMPIARGDYRYALRVGKRLDQALRRAASRTDADFVDVWKASRGHDVCSKDPWINGKDTDLTRAMSYHPFSAEQVAVAELVLAELGLG